MAKPKLFNMIKDGLEEAIAYEQGKIELRTKEVIIPNPPKEYGANDVKKLRKKLNFSQAIMAAYLNVSIKTVQAWEAGLRHPTSSALRLLEILDSKNTFEILFQLLKTKPRLS